MCVLLEQNPQIMRRASRCRAPGTPRLCYGGRGGKPGNLPTARGPRPVGGGGGEGQFGGFVCYVFSGFVPYYMRF